MDKSKSKKKVTTKGSKTTKKTEKSKKKKTTKAKKSKEEHIGEDNNNENIEVIDQKENNEEDVEYLKEKLNQPLDKKKLPPLDKEELNAQNENINNEEEKINNEEENIPIEKEEMGIGTPYFYDIGGLKFDLEQKNRKINEENISQEKYKISLNNLLNDLNKILSENVEILYDEGEDEIKRKKQEKIDYLQNVLFSYKQQKKDIIEKNKSYKQHYDLLLKQDETRIAQNAK